MSSKAQVSGEPRYGWVVVALAFLLFGVGNGALNSVSVFLVPLSTEFGWQRGETALAHTLATLAFGFAGIGMGWVAGRYAVRPLLLMGTLSMGAALWGLSQQTALWHLYLGHLVLGGLGYSTFWAPLLGNLGGWFTRNRGLAVGIATAGQMLGTGVVPFILRFLITAYGWRNAYRALALFFAAVLFPLSMLVREPLQREKARPTTKEAPLEQPALGAAELFPRPWFLLAWIGLGLFLDRTASGTTMIHLIALVEGKGFDPQSAAGVLLAFFIASFVARPVFGKLADFIGGLRTWILAVSGFTTLVFWFPHLHSQGGFYFLAISLGLFNATATAVIITVGELVSPRHRALGIALMSLCGFGGMGTGGWQAGIFFDLTGDYTASFTNAGFSAGAGLALATLLYFYVRRRRGELALQNA